MKGNRACESAFRVVFYMYCMHIYMHCMPQVLRENIFFLDLKKWAIQNVSKIPTLKLYLTTVYVHAHYSVGWVKWLLLRERWSYCNQSTQRVHLRWISSVRTLTIHIVTDVTLAGTGGGGWCTPLPWFFLSCPRSAWRIALKFRIANGASFVQLYGEKNWLGQVRSRSYDVIHRTTSDQFMTEIEKKTCCYWLEWRHYAWFRS